MSLKPEAEEFVPASVRSDSKKFPLIVVEDMAKGGACDEDLNVCQFAKTWVSLKDSGKKKKDPLDENANKISLLEQAEFEKSVKNLTTIWDQIPRTRRPNPSFSSNNDQIVNDCNESVFENEQNSTEDYYEADPVLVRIYDPPGPGFHYEKRKNYRTCICVSTCLELNFEYLFTIIGEKERICNCRNAREKAEFKRCDLHVFPSDTDLFHICAKYDHYLTYSLFHLIAEYHVNDCFWRPFLYVIAYLHGMPAQDVPQNKFASYFAAMFGCWDLIQEQLQKCCDVLTSEVAFAYKQARTLETVISCLPIQCKDHARNSITDFYIRAASPAVNWVEGFLAVSDADVPLPSCKFEVSDYPSQKMILFLHNAPHMFLDLMNPQFTTMLERKIWDNAKLRKAAQSVGCPWDLICLLLALKGRYEELVIAMQIGCDWDDLVIMAAVVRGDQKMLHFLWTRLVECESWRYQEILKLGKKRADSITASEKLVSLNELAQIWKYYFDVHPYSMKIPKIVLELLNRFPGNNQLVNAFFQYPPFLNNAAEAFKALCSSVRIYKDPFITSGKCINCRLEPILQKLRLSLDYLPRCVYCPSYECSVQKKDAKGRCHDCYIGSIYEKLMVSNLKHYFVVFAVTECPFMGYWPPFGKTSKEANILLKKDSQGEGSEYRTQYSIKYNEQHTIKRLIFAQSIAAQFGKTYLLTELLKKQKELQKNELKISQFVAFAAIFGNQDRCLDILEQFGCELDRSWLYIAYDSFNLNSKMSKYLQSKFEHEDIEEVLNEFRKLKQDENINAENEILSVLKKSSTSVDKSPSQSQKTKQVTFRRSQSLSVEENQPDKRISNKNGQVSSASTSRMRSFSNPKQ